MEFRYRAGDERPPSSFVRHDDAAAAFPLRSIRHDDAAAAFPLRSIRGGYFPAEIGGEAHLIRRPMPSMAALRREIQKERIREELIARDMAERRILEEEVRRELDMERAMGIRRVPLADSLVLAPQPPLQHMPEVVFRERIVPRPVPVPMVQEIAYRDPLRELELRDMRYPEERLREIVPLEEDHRPRVVTEPDFLQPMEMAHAAVGKPAVKEHLTKPKVPGKKRKAETDGLEQAKKIYSCSLCQVITTCAEHLDEHLTGKKHLANLAKLGSKDTRAATKASAPKVSAQKASVLKASEQKAVITLPKSNVAKKINMMVNGKLNQVTQKKSYLMCMRCRVKCNSTTMMYSHLSGKRHAEQVGQSERDDMAVKATAATTEDDKSNQPSEAEAKRDDLEDADKEPSVEVTESK